MLIAIEYMMDGKTLTDLYPVINTDYVKVQKMQAINEVTKALLSDKYLNAAIRKVEINFLLGNVSISPDQAGVEF